MAHSNRSKNKPIAGREPRPHELKAAREAAKLSQAQAAALIYTSPRTYEKWEQEIADRGAPASAYELLMIKTGQYRVLPDGRWQLGNGAVISPQSPGKGLAA
jgi:DNA-binding transcriptional regulator YiaG